MKFRTGICRLSRGITMVELLIAMIIISLTLIPFFGTMLWGQQKTELTVDRVVAENLALRFLEYLHGFEFDEITPDLELHLESEPDLFEPVEGFTVTPEIPADYEEAEIDISTGAGGGTGTVDKATLKYKIVKVKVTWTHQRKPKELQIADIFVSYKQ